MKQHLTPEDWGTYERKHPKQAASFRAWLDERDYPQDTSGCTLYRTEPVCIRANIGRLVEFLDEETDEFKTAYTQGDDPKVKWNRSIVWELDEELCDSLWKQVKEVLESEGT